MGDVGRAEHHGSARSREQDVKGEGITEKFSFSFFFEIFSVSFDVFCCFLFCGSSMTSHRVALCVCVYLFIRQFSNFAASSSSLHESRQVTVDGILLHAYWECACLKRQLNQSLHLVMAVAEEEHRNGSSETEHGKYNGTRVG
mmetsp:Transcript_57771/g.66466  ORF Transcript_57771/g.66466 Transcript_57771/m.66466 type:complete len:143 (-) Transcript_57771:374-802(-)